MCGSEERTFVSGFLVRCPAEERPDGEFREYRIGRVWSEPDEFGDVEIELTIEGIGGQIETISHRFPATALERCRALSGSPFLHDVTGHRGRILIAENDECPSQGPLNYFVLLDGRVQKVPETHLVVGSTYQDPDPRRQLQRYEFHNPSWRWGRDVMVETIAELGNFSYGLAELVASRVMLLPHQAEVVAKVLASHQCRFILADEVGLGKTIEASLILKGLRRQDPGLWTLIVAPGSLVHQWQRELDDRFWMNFRAVTTDGIITGPGAGEVDKRGFIVSTEAFKHDPTVRDVLSRRAWGLMIIDEAHQVRKDPVLYEQLQNFSRDAERVLLLSATPIQRHATEYVALLRLMDPNRYETVTNAEFDTLLKLQGSVRRTVSFLSRGLDPDVWDVEEFLNRIEDLTNRLSDDRKLLQLVAKVETLQESPRRSLAAAAEALAYVSENYRLESRVIRNRRAQISAPVPIRELNADYIYDPAPAEEMAVGALVDHVSWVAGQALGPIATEYIRVLLHAAASSPAALIHVLRMRRAALTNDESGATPDVVRLTTPGPVRFEQTRIRDLVHAVPIKGDQDALEPLIYLVERWEEHEVVELENSTERRGSQGFPLASRIGRALAAISGGIGRERRGKVIVFSAWPQTLDILERALETVVGRRGFVSFRAGLSEEDLQSAADRFQTDPHLLVLLSDELGGEGRNFQLADSIVHVDLPWTPAVLEQRIGRVDRIGRSGTVPSTPIVARGTPEEQLFHIWQDAFQLFTKSMSGLEIALEEIQDEILAAIGRHPRDGLAELLTPMCERATTLREIVEEERYAEEGAIDRRFRDDFERTAERYRTGGVLGNAIGRWSKLAGLHSSFDSLTDIVTYSPRQFNETAMANAKVVALPDMTDAVRRSRRRNSLEVRGTFNRDLAIHREDLVFFAPGSDPWTDAVIANALTADRGRSCAILWEMASISWTGVEFLFTVAVNPRPLYQRGFDPTKLFAGQGYLRVPVQRVMVSLAGEVLSSAHPVTSNINICRKQRITEKHLGRRSNSNLTNFQRLFPSDLWEPKIDQLSDIARAHVAEEFSFLVDEAETAREDFARRARGAQAANSWFRTEVKDALELQLNEEVAEALIEGIATPLIRLESACVWMLRQRGEAR